MKGQTLPRVLQSSRSVFSPRFLPAKQRKNGPFVCERLAIGAGISPAFRDIHSGRARLGKPGHNLGYLEALSRN